MKWCKLHKRNFQSIQLYSSFLVFPFLCHICDKIIKVQIGKIKQAQFCFQFKTFNMSYFAGVDLRWREYDWERERLRGYKKTIYFPRSLIFNVFFFRKKFSNKFMLLAWESVCVCLCVHVQCMCLFRCAFSCVLYQL